MKNICHRLLTANQLICTIITVIFFFNSYKTYTAQPSEAKNIVSFSGIRKVKDLTCSPEGTMFALASNFVGRFVFEQKKWLGIPRWEEIVEVNNAIKSIHALSNNDLLLLSPQTLTYRNASAEEEKMLSTFKMANFFPTIQLPENGTIVGVAGRSLDQLWLTYATENGLIKSTLFAIKNGELSTHNQTYDYKSIGVSRDNKVWALKSDGKTLDIIGILASDDEEDITDVDIDIDTSIPLTIPLAKIYVHTSEYIFGLDESGTIYQWSPQEKQFSSIPLPSFMPSSGYISFTSPSAGPVYSLNQDGKAYTIPLATIKTIPKQKPQAATPTPATQETTKETPITTTPAPSTEPEIRKPAAATKAQQQMALARQQTILSNLKKQTQLAPRVPSPPVAQTQNPPRLPEESPRRTLEQEIQKKIVPQEWQEVSKEIQDPSFEAGFNAGLIAGIQANPEFSAILSELRAFYKKGIADGPKGCVLDTMFWHIADIIKQESSKTIKEKLQKAPSDIWKGLLK